MWKAMVLAMERWSSALVHSGRSEDTTFHANVVMPYITFKENLPAINIDAKTISYKSSHKSLD